MIELVVRLLTIYPALFLFRTVSNVFKDLFQISSSRRLSAISDMIRCPRLTYLYPFPTMTPRFHPWLSPKDFLASIFTSFPFLNKSRKKNRRKYLSSSILDQSSLSLHIPIISKIVDIEKLSLNFETVIKISLTRMKPFDYCSDSTLNEGIELLLG